MQPLISCVLLGTITNGTAGKPRAWGSLVAAVTGGKETFFEEAKNNMGEFGNNGMEDFVNQGV